MSHTRRLMAPIVALASVALAPSLLLAGPCVLSCPADIVQNTDAGCGASVDFDLPNGDCLDVECDPAPGAFFPVGTSTVECTSTTDDCSFLVTVVDAEPPTIVCPGTVTASNDVDRCDAVVMFGISASDNCPGVMAPCTPASGSQFPVGTTTVSCAATDASGNAALCSFPLTVNDTQPPDLDTPGDLERLTSGGQPVRVVFPTTLFAIDNCPNNQQATCVPPTRSLFPAGITTVTCTGSDVAGNVTVETFLVIVSHAAPVLGAGMLVILCAGLAAVAVRKLRARA
jgi:hypothetical protein